MRRAYFSALLALLAQAFAAPYANAQCEGAVACQCTLTDPIDTLVFQGNGWYTWGITMPAWTPVLGCCAGSPLSSCALQEEQSCAYAWTAGVFSIVDLYLPGSGGPPTYNFRVSVSGGSWGDWTKHEAGAPWPPSWNPGAGATTEIPCGEIRTIAGIQVGDGQGVILHINLVGSCRLCPKDMPPIY